jgi:hypothetical protein
MSGTVITTGATSTLALEAVQQLRNNLFTSATLVDGSFSRCEIFFRAFLGSIVTRIWVFLLASQGSASFLP